MAEGKSKTWILVAVIAGIIIVALIIWAYVSSKNSQKVADQQDIAATKADIQNPALPQSLRDCRKACRVICKDNHKQKWFNYVGALWTFGATLVVSPLTGRRNCKNKCESDCQAGVDVLKNKANY